MTLNIVKANLKATQAIFDRYRSLPSNEAHNKIMDDLLRFCSFQEITDKRLRPNPFDDPYVGAVIATEHFQVIGVHRKIEGSEIHAEPKAILNALVAISEKNQTAKDLIRSINTAYEEKIWLRSKGKIIEFEKLFEASGKLLSECYGGKSLHLYSTLEPCRDYETQPSCSCIICAVGVTKVFYGSDDTNDKGKGRSNLETGKDNFSRTITLNPPEVRPNIAVSESLEVNKLFFTTHAVVESFFKKLEIGKKRAGAAYSIFNLNEDYLTPHFGQNGRLEHQLKDGVILPIFNVATPEIGLNISPRTQPPLIENSNDSFSRHIPELSHVDKKKLSMIRDKVIDSDTALVLKHPAENYLLEILHDRASSGLSLPGKIIATHTLNNISYDLKKYLEEERYSIFENSFRKQDENFSAHRHVLVSYIRNDQKDCVYLVGKIKIDDSQDEEPYISFYGEIENAEAFLANHTRSINRLSIYASVANSSKVGDLLSRLESKSVFRATGSLSHASIEIRIGLLPSFSEHESSTRLLKQQFERDGLQNRVVVKSEILNTALTAENVSSLLTQTAIDPSLFSRAFLKDLSSSLDWRDRRNAGLVLAQILSREPSLIESFITEEINFISNEGIDGQSWARLCSYLNALEDLKYSPTGDRQECVITALENVSNAINLTAELGQSCPWLIDVIWRWSACWIKFSNTSAALAKPFRNPRFRSFFEQNEFLFSQLLLYAFRNNMSDTKVIKIIDQFDHISDPQIVRSVSVMAARLQFAGTQRGSSNSEVYFSTKKSFLKNISKTAFEIYIDEFDRCKRVWKERLGAVEKAQCKIEMGKAFATLTNLRTLVPSIIHSNEYPSVVPKDSLGHSQTWRGDQTTTASNSLRELSPEAITASIEGLVNDPDVSTRWSGLSYSFGRESRALVESVAPNRSKSELHNLRNLRLRLVKRATENTPHYWLTREVLSHYISAREANASTNKELRDEAYYGWALPPISSIPVIRHVFETSRNDLHPEVLKKVDEYNACAKTIALVLPPLLLVDAPDQASDKISANSNHSSPPLGLGQIAAHISSEGHFVDIIDAHRFSIEHDNLLSTLLKYDYVGFNVVISTLPTTQAICRDLISRAEEGKRPKIVIGGQAATLLSDEQIESSSLFYDFLVRGAGERAFSKILNTSYDIANRAPIEHPEIIVRKNFRRNTTESNSALKRKQRELLSKSAKTYHDNWRNFTWVDRELFRDHVSGEQYEPAPTRNIKFQEAHIVMSKGCDWGCNFCTEAIIGGSFGESRRSVDDVSAEIISLINRHSIQRVQFVDDNVLPPRPETSRNGKASTIKIQWVKDFISALEDVRLKQESSRKSFSWRGLMRVEDFLDYKRLIPDFTKKLTKSGCNLLAFGIEAGSEEHRAKLKGNSRNAPTNEDIITMVRDLKLAGIATKGYFILGGEGQKKKDIEETVSFAIQAKFDIAYFAIYKAFRKFTSTATSVGNLRDFNLFASTIDAALSGRKNSYLWEQTFGNEIPISERPQYVREYRKLKNLGFSFEQTIKYNDFHSDDEFYRAFEFTGAADYLRALSRAYLQFYCREGWSDRYKHLVKSGY